MGRDSGRFEPAGSDVWVTAGAIGACYTCSGASMTERIEINPSVMLGKPVIRNTRIPVELLLRKLAEGASTSDLLDAYPRLTEHDIRACLAYAADTIAHESIYSLSSE